MENNFDRFKKHEDYDGSLNEEELAQYFSKLNVEPEDDYSSFNVYNTGEHVLVHEKTMEITNNLAALPQPRQSIFLSILMFFIMIFCPIIGILLYICNHTEKLVQIEANKVVDITTLDRVTLDNKKL